MTNGEQKPDLEELREIVGELSESFMRLTEIVNRLAEREKKEQENGRV